MRLLKYYRLQNCAYIVCVCVCVCVCVWIEWLAYEWHAGQRRWKACNDQCLSAFRWESRDRPTIELLAVVSADAATTFGLTDRWQPCASLTNHSLKSNHLIDGLCFQINGISGYSYCNERRAARKVIMAHQQVSFGNSCMQPIAPRKHSITRQAALYCYIDSTCFVIFIQPPFIRWIIGI